MLEGACLRRMRELNPDFHIVCMDASSIPFMPIGYETLTAQHKSDWARVSAIADTGGVWMDVSCVLLKPIATWVDMTAEAVQGFTVPWSECGPIMENWAFAAPANNTFMRAWREEFRMAIGVGFQQYKRDVMRTTKLPCSKMRWWTPYLTQHLAYWITRKRLPDAPIILHDSRTGPFLIQEMCKSSMDCDLYQSPHLPDVPFVKLTGGGQRQHLIERPLSKFERILQLRIDVEVKPRRYVISGLAIIFVICVYCVGRLRGIQSSMQQIHRIR